MKIHYLDLTPIWFASLVLTFCIFFGTDVRGQTVKGWEVVPPSPDAAALGKYGNTPVGLATGIPEINVPLYVIKTKKLALPITMSYHAAGFNVNDRAPWTGLGWTLNAGGVISRSAVGLGDDNGAGFLQHNNNRFANEINENDLQWLMQVTSGIADNESDMYFFNFAGRSGKFVFDDNRKPFLVPQMPIKITYSTSSGFQVIGEDGTVYRFAEREMIEAGAQTPSGNDFQTYTGAYYLTSITSADGTDVITFTYANDGYYTELSTNYSETIGDKCVPTDNSIAVVGKSHDYNTSFNYRTVQDVKRLTEINFSNGKVEFVRTPGRLDGGNSSLTEIRIKKKNAAGGFDLDKSFKTEMGYFGTSSQGRLKLNAIAEYDASNSFVKSHEFFYNESTILPGRGSRGQDWWGLYNGGTANSLVPKEIVNLGGHFYHVGSANRSPSAKHMQACILKTIKYPTGGFTEFEYEPHYYEGTSTVPRDTGASSGAMNNTTDLLQDVKTFTTNRDGFAMVRAHCSNSVVSESGGNPYFSTVTLRKIGGSTLVNHAYDPYPPDPSGEFKSEKVEEFLVQLSPGTYELKVTSKGTSTSPYYNGGAFSKATVTWADFAPTGTPVMAGGLRVKETRDYEGPGAAPIIKIYKYGINESGKGILITPENKLSSHKETRDFRYWDIPPQGNFCRVMCTTTRQTIFGNTPHDLTTFNGSAVIYPEVAVYEKSTSAPNGKSVHKFTAEPDEIYGAPQGYKDGVILIDNSWKVNDLIYSADFIANTTNKTREVTNTYPILQQSTTYSTKMGRKYANNGTCGPTYMPTDVYSAFYYFDFPIRTGIKKLGSTTERSYSTTDPTKYIESKVNYFYDNLNSNHQQLSRRVTLDSEGNTLNTQYWYPADYSAIDNMPALMTKNIINKPIKEETHRNGLFVAGKINRLNADGDIFEVYQHESPAPLAPPAHNANALIPPGYNKKIDVAYDASTKNITKVQAVDDVSATYLWAYSNTFPIAKAVNASVTDIAATSFESDGKGNWVYNGAIYNDIPAKTGRYYYKLGGGSIVKGLAPGKYKLEYWAKGIVNLSGMTVANIRTSVPDANGWILYEKELSTSAAATLTLSGTATAFVDELRLYPASAQITTYTYDRLAGITSVNDPAGVITYYDYDSSGRLKWLRDKNGSVVKAFEYHYKAK